MCQALCWAEQQTRQTEQALVVIAISRGRRTIHRALLHRFVDYSCDTYSEVKKPGVMRRSLCLLCGLREVALKNVIFKLRSEELEGFIYK